MPASRQHGRPRDRRRRVWGIGLLCAAPVLLVMGLLLAFTIFGIAAAVLALACVAVGTVLVVLDDRAATARRRR